MDLSSSRSSRARFHLGALRSSASLFALGSFALCAPLAACGGAAKPASVAPPAAFAPAPSPPPVAIAAAPAPLPPGVPDSPAGHQLAWVLAAIAKAPTEAEAAPHFAPAFTAEISAQKVAELFAQLGPQISPVAIDRVEPGPNAESLSVVVHRANGDDAAGPKLKISLHVEPAEPARITGLLLRPSIEAKAVSSWDEAQSGLRAVAPQVGLLAAEISDGKCVPLSSIEPKKPLALGSAFKLFILNALAEQIAAGKHGWDDSIAIDDAKKSLPTGDMRNEPAGKTFHVREMAAQMISVSDNTATDHLLAFVGRAAVEANLKAAGLATPARDVPFLSTRDLFALKLLGTPDELKGYAAADVAHKRKLLEGFEARDLSKVPLEEHGWDKPRAIDSIEWFASPEDLCRVMASLKKYAETPATAPVGAILSANPGVPDETGAFKYIGFKGGSEPGVLNMTWLLQRKGDGDAGGKWLFLATTFNDPSAARDAGTAIVAATAARNFLAR